MLKLKLDLKENQSSLSLKYAQHILFIIYVAVTFTLLCFHEPWRDETQKWLIVRDNNFWNAILASRYEGHPSLWIIFLYPLVKLALPVFTMQLLNWCIVSGAVYLFIKKAPLHIYIKYTFCLSYLMMFEYSVIARNYCILILALTLICVFYPKRFDKSILYAFLLLFLSQTHTLAFGFFIGLVIIYLYEICEYKIKQNNIFIFLGIILMSILLLYLQLKRPSDAGINFEFQVLTFERIFLVLNNYLQNQLSIINPVPVYSIYSLVFLPIIFIGFSFNKKTIFLYFSSVMVLVIVGNFVYYFSAWHKYLYFLYIIFIIWISSYYKSNQKLDNISKNIATILLCLILFISDFYFLRFIVAEIKQPFSASVEAANIIKTKKLDKKYIIVGYKDYAVSSILYLIPDLKIYYPERKQFGTYIIWDNVRNKYDKINGNMRFIKENIRIFDIDSSKVLLLFSKLRVDLDSTDYYGLKLIDSTKNTFSRKEEEFYFFVYK